ncbi:MAG TPA: c-type cytochrome [Caulobacteraceae bacterium]|jgi:cytochrome c553|nr:c-type cytochrome [Caulobacteraceae bacterium]
MREVAIGLAAGGLVLIAAACAAKNDFPDWAYPGLGAEAPGTPAQAAENVTVPRSHQTFPRSRLENLRGQVADWFPKDHPTAPDMVVTPKGTVAACGYCHLPGGEGRPENASLAGLPFDYIKAQIAAFRSGDRAGAKPDWLPTALMIPEAKGVSDADLNVVADYFSKLPYQSRFRVVETKDVNRPVASGFLLSPGSGPKEPIGDRILEAPSNPDLFEKRDPQVTFIAYVPEGSVARGKALAMSGGPAKQPCSACHGSDLRGGEGLPGPPLAGRAPVYLFRQLYAFHTGGRKGAAAEPMRLETEKLTQSDMVDLAAYLASQPAN